MTKILENLELDVVDGRKVWKCGKCAHVLGDAAEDYKNLAMKHDAPMSRCNASQLPVNEKTFILREYYCPKCAGMFEVDMVPRDHEQIRSIRLA